MPVPCHGTGVSAGASCARMIVATPPSAQSFQGFAASHDFRMPHPDIPRSTSRFVSQIVIPAPTPSLAEEPERYLASPSCRSRAFHSHAGGQGLKEQDAMISSTDKRSPATPRTVVGDHLRERHCRVRNATPPAVSTIVNAST